MKITLRVTGLEVEAEYTEKEINQVLLPLLNQINQKRAEKGSRVIAYLAAPPGTGKTTLSLFMEYLYKQQDFPYTFQSVSIDGYHHKREYLLTHWLEEGKTRVRLNDVKGSPESFNLEVLKRNILTLQHSPVEWAVYDRQLHDVSEETTWVDADIVLIEGNWLLLNEENWDELRDYCDLSIFIEAEESLLRPRLIERKMKGGFSQTEAAAFYAASDRKNVCRVLAHRQKSNILLGLSPTGELLCL
ncbi:nucleoside/nucleotide kinase family protein [Atopococcus tabaci]|uniref:nucleoside/nucleotide kinase family protein n=1 Tax=Atopococcus tabaci TaxID=269774 RepID=UPI00240A252E|nr:nucleoside/nucleotide kinase family protein [Atopococcus tabaci]